MWVHSLCFGPTNAHIPQFFHSFDTGLHLISLFLCLVGAVAACVSNASSKKITKGTTFSCISRVWADAVIVVTSTHGNLKGK